MAGAFRPAGRGRRRWAAGAAGGRGGRRPVSRGAGRAGGQDAAVLGEQGPVRSRGPVRPGAAGGRGGDPAGGGAPDRAAGAGGPGAATAGCAWWAGRSGRARVRAWWMRAGQVPVRGTDAAAARAGPRRPAGVTRRPAAAGTVRPGGNRCSVRAGMTTPKRST